MKETTRKIYDELFERYPQLSAIKDNILKAFSILNSTYKNGGVLYCAGNGGSSADSEHIVGELLKSFKKPRKVDEQTTNKLLSQGDDGKYLLSKLEGSLPAVSLISQTGIIP